MRSRTALVIAVTVILLAAGVILAVVRFGGELPVAIGRACEVRTDTGTVTLKADQMANAATIAAVGIRKHVPDQAIVVALSAAFQESKLENLPHGDRDSVGLFQQRPSQGWGPADQLRDPRFAATRFYNALLRVPGWEEMRVTEAAQRVQRSAYPEAYQKWAGEAAVLVEALGGHAASALTCTQIGAPEQRGEAAAQALNTGLQLDWGTIATTATSDVIGLAIAPRSTRAGWQLAHWIVAHSSASGVERVSFGAQQWSAESGRWQAVAADPQARLVAEVYRA